MGAGCSNKRDNSPLRNGEVTQKKNKIDLKNIETVNRKNSLSVYHFYPYQNVSSLSANLIIFTDIYNFTNEFTVLEGQKKESNCNNTYKINGVAVGYYKGYKLDVHNQDKFFVLIDGNFEVYCLIDGHGPYGNVIGQIVQNKIFKEVTQIIFQDEFEKNYEKLMINLFEKIHNGIIEKDEPKFKDDYDAYLSGVAVTLVIKKDNNIYCANVGNVMALLFYAERIYSYKFKLKELTSNDSDFKAEIALANYNMISPISKLNHRFTNNPTMFNFNTNLNANSQMNQNFSHSNTADNFTMGNSKLTYQPTIELNEMKENTNSSHSNHIDMKEELTRIYECGGEVRKLAGEDKSRIFVKGKYFPGLINTRSLGDQIGISIGVSFVPHIKKYSFQEKNNYYLIMCTDGITNVLKEDTIVNIIEANDVCKINFNYFVVPLESINSIIQTAKQEYRKNSYCPDMTIILKSLNTKIKN